MPTRLKNFKTTKRSDFLFFFWRVMLLVVVYINHVRNCLRRSKVSRAKRESKSFVCVSGSPLERLCTASGVEAIVSPDLTKVDHDKVEGVDAVNLALVGSPEIVEGDSVALHSPKYMRSCDSYVTWILCVPFSSSSLAASRPRRPRRPRKRATFSV